MTKLILGIDEVGRGPWAGPLVVGAVVLGENFQKLPEYNDLRDSKKISAKKREKLAKIIQDNALGYGIGWVKPTEIDQRGLGPALKFATRRAVKQILNQNIKFNTIIIDGTINLLADTPLAERVSLLPKADNLVKEVSAASIIAKVARDNYMVEVAEKYPEYGFEKHVGYGTKFHRDALQKYGICPEHRRSFRPIAQIIAKNPEKGAPEAKCYSEIPTINAVQGYDNQKTGHLAENAIADYLKNKGQVIIQQNYRTCDCEIDLISTDKANIYFTEVKYHKSLKNGDPIEQVTPQKLQQMRRASEIFLQKHPEFQNFQPLLAVAGVSGEDFEVQTWLTLG